MSDSPLRRLSLRSIVFWVTLLLGVALAVALTILFVGDEGGPTAVETTSAPGTSAVEPSTSATSAPPTTSATTATPLPELALDPDLPPEFALLTLDVGFTEQDLTSRSGGPANAEYLGGDCVGWTSVEPQFQFDWVGGPDGLRFFFLPGDANHDTALIVADPVASWHCNNDSYGTRHPTIDLPAAPEGRYSLWITSIDPDARVEGELFVTTPEGNHP